MGDPVRYPVGLQPPDNQFCIVGIIFNEKDGNRITAHEFFSPFRSDRVKQKVAPHPIPADSAQNLPPWISIILLQIASPTPVPLLRGSSFSKSSKTFSRYCGS